MIKFVIQKARRRVSRVPLNLTDRNKERFAQQAEEAVRADFLHGIQRFKQRVPKAAIDEAFNTGGYEGLRKTIPWHELDGDMQKTAERLSGVVDDAAHGTITGIYDAPPDKYRTNAANPQVAELAKDRMGKYLQDLSDEHNANIHEIVHDASRYGLTPKQVADRVHNSIGLNKRQNFALSRYENGLIEGGKHNKRQIKQLTDAYAQRLQKERADMIAVTETRIAANTAQQAAWDAQISDGLLERTAMRVWVIEAGACPICQFLDGKAVKVDEPWTLESGETVMNPGEVHPRCRCDQFLITSDDAHYADYVTP